MILDVQNISKRFGGLLALDKVTFNIQEGEILGLIGPNGAGKTTMFNVINGVYPPQDGRVVFRDEDITGLPPYEVSKRGIARTHQIVRPLGELTVKENVTAGACFGRQNLSLGAAGEVRQDLRYGYDAVGNVTSEADTRNVTGGTPGFQRQCFLYDALNRLLRAWTTAGYCNFTTPNPDTQGAQPYDESYTYQANGNLATKGVTGSPPTYYNYGAQAVDCPEGTLATKTHAVVAVGTDKYCYDQNGNMRRRDIWGQTETLSYDAENHHTAPSSSPSGAQYAFTYDGDGARATATTGTGASGEIRSTAPNQ